LTDNDVLDLFFVPFGSWMEQAEEWISAELRWLLAIIEWPFRTLNDLLVEDVLMPMTWVGVTVAFFAVGTLVRSLRVGVFAGVAIALCGFLSYPGETFWRPTVETISFVIVAVLACVIIGLPLGVACGRIDSLWSVVRPVLDGMQVIHAFVYMIPFIGFFGIGNVGATIVTMFFAIPPLVRLTNLGIRQVPADVVEASRAYGAPEWRVLFDVQVPLARPAIMTGINQTLLLAISMLGIAAIMGAKGLGGLLFAAISRQDVAAAAPAGLAFYLVAVVFDRISQPEGAETGGLLRRLRRAWAHRRDPEALVPAEESTVSDQEAEAPGDQGAMAPLTSAERRPMVVAAVGGAVAAASVLLTWTADSGFLSAYGRRADERLPGESFNGLSASGGSWFGILAVVLGLFVVAAVVNTWVSPGRGPRGLTSDGAVIASIALLVMMASYLLASPSELAIAEGASVGPWIALAGALVASAGSVGWIRRAPHVAARPLSSRIRWGCVGAAVFGVVVFAVAAVSVWSFDERGEVVVTPAVRAQLEELEARAAANPEDAAVIALEIAELRDELKVDFRIIIDGISRKGAGLGVWTLVAGLAGLAAALPAAGVLGRDEHRQWRWSAITAGIGAGAACVAFGWIFTQVRSADLDYWSGVGSFLAVAAGLVLVAAVAAVIKEFGRAKVYADDAVALTEEART
jgi:glycine betaine/proline transport system permease protein